LLIARALDVVPPGSSPKSVTVTCHLPTLYVIDLDASALLITSTALP